MAAARRRAIRIDDVLRALLAALVVANLVFFAYARGALDSVLGLRPLGDREPERLAHQFKPESIRLLPARPAASAVAEAATCWETAAFTAAESAAVEPVLASTLPAGSWLDVRADRVVGTRTETSHVYRVANADPTLAAKLQSLRLDPAGKGFSACARADRPR
jgi:hypothetical protein